MTNPDDEKIIEEFKKLHCTERHGIFFPATQTAEGQIGWLRQTLTTIREEHAKEMANFIEELRAYTFEACPYEGTMVRAFLNSRTPPTEELVDKG